MRLESVVLTVPAAPGNGASAKVRDLTTKYVQVGGTFTGSLNIEVSLNGTDYVPTVAGITAPGLFEVPEPATYVRMAVGSLSSGTPTATLNGYDIRTD
jgi:hypothetical protein